MSHSFCHLFNISDLTIFLASSISKPISISTAGCCAAATASLSACSLPGMTTCEGIHTIVRSILYLATDSNTCRNSTGLDNEEDPVSMALTELRESVKMVNLTLRGI